MIRPLSLTLRTIAFFLGVAALLQPGIFRIDAAIHTVYILDTSASIEGDQLSSMVDFVRASTEALEAPDTAALIAFSAEPEIVLEPVSSGRQIKSALQEVVSLSVPGSPSDAGKGFSRFSPAIQLGAALLPPSGDRRLVLLSDGLPTDGASITAGSENVRVSTVFAPPSIPSPEVRIAAVHAPPEAAEGDLFSVSVTIESSLATSLVLEVTQDGDSRVREETRVVPGMQTFTYRLRAVSPAPISVRIDAELDRFVENNRAETRVLLRDTRPILYVVPSEDDPITPQAARALALQGHDTTLMSARAFPADIEDLLPYDLVVLDDIPAEELSLPAMAALERYVRNGGGTVIFGGADSFGSGDFVRTPLENLLPVSFDITSRVQVPSLAILFLVDRSGSMGGSSGGTSKLDLVKAAILASMEVLQPNQIVGLLAFDADSEWTIPFTAASERESIMQNVATLSSGGGTILSQAMEAALASMNEIESMGKHLVILSDGLTREADFEELAARVRETGISISTVSIGHQADRGRMELIARVGGGRYYHTEEAEEIPRIFARETGIVARNSVLEETFFPVPAEESPALAGIDVLDIPPFHGYVLTYPKATAELILTAPQGQPLLAEWQYGAGRSAALTSTLRGSWGADWISWDLLPRLLGQLADLVARPPGSPGVSTTVAFGDETTTLRLSLTDAGGYPRLYESPMELHLTTPDRRERSRPMTAVGPGIYEAAIPTEIPGSYLATIREGDRQIAFRSFTRSYSPEYNMRPPDASLLRETARRGGGIAVSVTDRSFPHERLPLLTETAPARRDLWPVLLAAAILLFVLETLGSALHRRVSYRRSLAGGLRRTSNS